MSVPTVNAPDEWSTLKECIVGVAEHSCFPYEETEMIKATMPEKYIPHFHPLNPFPADIVAKASDQLENFCSVLEEHGVIVHRPRIIDWADPSIQGYTAAMVRDSIFVADNVMLEAPMSWKCRKNEGLALAPLFDLYAKNSNNHIVHRPPHPLRDTLLNEGGTHIKTYVINDSRPAFDAADFIKVGSKTIIGQYSNVTNPAGVEWLRAQLKNAGSDYEVVIIDTDDVSAMHIDATIMPLKEGLMLCHPTRADPKVLAEIPALKGWKFITTPTGNDRDYPPLYMTSPWIIMNILVISPTKAIIEAEDDALAKLLEENGIEPIRVPFKYVHSLGGSLHCATVDVSRVAA